MTPGLEAAAAGYGVGRRFGELEAVENIDLELPRGRITAIVGANGAGKTTLLRLLAGILEPTAGRVEVLGRDAPASAPRSVTRELRRRLAYISQDLALDPEMTGGETLSLMATLYGVARTSRPRLVRETAEAFGLTAAMGRLVGDWSGGQRRRLHLAAGLVHDPELLLLDEPAAGLDIEGQDFLWAELVRRCEQGRAVAVISHDLAAVERHAHRVAILGGGRLLRLGPPAELRDELRRVIEEARNEGDRRRGGRGGPGGRSRGHR